MGAEGPAADTSPARIAGDQPCAGSKDGGRCPRDDADAVQQPPKAMRPAPRRRGAAQTARRAGGGGGLPLPQPARTGGKRGARTVYLVEDHPVYRDGLARVLNDQPDLVVCGAAATAEAALPDIRRLRPDLVLIDLTLPGRSGLQLIREIRRRDRAVKLLVVSMHDEAVYAERVLRAGGDGYIMKEEDAQEIVRAARDVLLGRIYVSEEVLAARRASAPRGGRRASRRLLDRLADDELRLLELLGRGKDLSDMAVELALPISRVRQQCLGIRRKLGLKNEVSLVRYAVCWVESGKG